jgi:hypothetical protein
MVLWLNSEPVIPCEAVAYNKAAQDVIGADDTDHSEGKERQGNSESQEGLVINETRRSARSSKGKLMADALVFLGEAQNLASNIPNDSTNDTREQYLI